MYIINYWTKNTLCSFYFIKQFPHLIYCNRLARTLTAVARTVEEPFQHMHHRATTAQSPQAVTILLDSSLSFSSLGHSPTLDPSILRPLASISLEETVNYIGAFHLHHSSWNGTLAIYSNYCLCVSLLCLHYIAYGARPALKESRVIFH